MFSKGIMGGTSETKFEPETNIDRGMIVTMLHRLEGTPEAAPSAFTDVKAEQYCAEAIGWASRNGIVQGYSDTEFRPSREIRCERLASILYRYAQLKGCDTREQADFCVRAVSYRRASVTIPLRLSGTTCNILRHRLKLA